MAGDTGEAQQVPVTLRGTPTAAVPLAGATEEEATGRCLAILEQGYVYMNLENKPEGNN